MKVKQFFVTICFFCLLIFSVFAQVTLSVNCPDYDTCLKSANELAKQRDSYISEIQYIDTQISLIGLQIQQTEQKIISTQKEVDILESRIEGLDTSLTYLSKLLLQRVVDGYKQRSVSIFKLLFDSNNANDFISRIKYQKTVQENNQKLLVQVEQTKLNFEEQKKLREEKKVELDNLKTTLDNQKIDLNKEQDAKKNLLTITEAEYNQAQAQLAAFKTFVANTGLGVISADSSWPGDYYSQRDSRWASRLIGYSNDDIFHVGCLLTSVAMVLKKNGVNTDPSVIASNSNYFDGNTANMKYRDSISWPNGLKGYHISPSQVDDELSAGHYVIAGINYGGCRSNSDHFVVLTQKDGNDYKMYDPLYGPNEHFYSRYSQICWADVIK